MHNRRPRFAVLREDLFAITGDQLMALILDRLLYDTSRVGANLVPGVFYFRGFNG